MQANSGIPGFKPSDYPPLATGKVRFVGEPSPCACRQPGRRRDLAAVELDLDELPPVVDMLAARQPGAALAAQHWGTTCS